MPRERSLSPCNIIYNINNDWKINQDQNVIHPEQDFKENPRDLRE